MRIILTGIQRLTASLCAPYPPKLALNFVNPGHFSPPTQEGKEGVKKAGKGAKKRAREEKEASIRAAEMARWVWGQAERVERLHTCTYLFSTKEK